MGFQFPVGSSQLFKSSRGKSKKHGKPKSWGYPNSIQYHPIAGWFNFIENPAWKWMIWGIPSGNLHMFPSQIGHPPLLWGQSQGRLLLPIESRVAGFLAPIFGQGWCENLVWNSPKHRQCIPWFLLRYQIHQMNHGIRLFIALRPCPPKENPPNACSCLSLILAVECDCHINGRTKK